MEIKFKDIDALSIFHKEIQNIDCDIDIFLGTIVIDAKSLIGVYSLDLTKKYELLIHSDDKEIINKVNNLLSISECKITEGDKNN